MESKFSYTAARAMYSALSTCAALFPSTDASSGGGLFADSEDDPEYAELLRQANADDQEDGQEDRYETDLTPAGRVRADYSTPSARFNPY